MIHTFTPLALVVCLFGLACTCEGRRPCVVFVEPEPEDTGFDTGEALDCNLESFPSSRIVVQDAYGEPFSSTEPLVEYSVNGGGFFDCESEPEVPELVCGRGQVGSFLVRVSAEAYATTELTFEVELSEMGCSLQTQTRAVQMHRVESGDSD